MSSADIAHLSLTITSAESAPVPPPASGGGRSWIVYRRTLLPNMRGCAHRARPLQRRKYAGPRFHAQRMPAGANSTSSWHGQSTGSDACCEDFSKLFGNCCHDRAPLQNFSFSRSLASPIDRTAHGKHLDLVRRQVVTKCHRSLQALELHLNVRARR
jgi:hypothetical protein